MPKRNYKDDLIHILKDFNMSNPKQLVESLSNHQAKQFYLLLQKVMIRVAVKSLGE